MSRLELLNVFVNDRLTAAGDEILRAVKDALLEYQSEIVRSKEENERLRRLLNVAVQRLLQPEPQALHPRQDVQQREWRTGVELFPQVKEEPRPRNIQTDCLQEARDSEEGSCSHDEPPQSLHPRSAENMYRKQSISTPQQTSQELKTESDSEGDRKQQSAKTLASSQTARSSCPVSQNDSFATAKRHRTKQSTHILHIRNARSMKQPLPHSSHPSQSIQRWHSCKECGKGFSFACQLEVHMRWHTKEKPYSCAVCRKSFTTVSMLKRHHRIHTGEKPFRCHVCGKCFNQSAHLNTHFRLHTRERASWSRTPHSK